MSIRSTDALLIVDVQNDFCANGALAVPGGDAVVPLVNEVAAEFARQGALVLASRDWHPAETTHFVGQGGPWPVHCVAGTRGAAFHPRLVLPERTEIVTKGADPGADGYSAFEGRLASGETLADALQRRGITRLYVAGLATDYCVKHSALDARRAGLDVTVLEDAVRAVNASPDDGRRALGEMRSAGATIDTSAGVLQG